MKGYKIIMNERAEFIPVSKEQYERIDEIRNAFSDLYDKIDSLCKENRETSLVYTKLEEAQFWAIKGITREEK
jgi:iron uptake system EfeUOB component EfeO/EfeM